MAENDNLEVDKGGRPTDYRAVYAKQAFKFCLLGATNEQLAGFFDVSIATIKNWMKAHPKFLAAVKAGKDQADAEMAESLFNKGIGFTRTVTTVDVNAAGEKTKKKKVEYFAPDVTAQIFWLKNRRPDLWREKKEIDHKFDGPVTIQYGEKPGNDPIEDDEAAV